MVEMGRVRPHRQLSAVLTIPVQDRRDGRETVPLKDRAGKEIPVLRANARRRIETPSASKASRRTRALASPKTLSMRPCEIGPPAG